MKRDSIRFTLLVALVLCVVCSFVVSTAAVLLNDAQTRNKALDAKRNILVAADLAEKATPAKEIEAIFSERIKRVLINLDTAEVVPESEQPYDEYNPREAAQSRDMSEEIEVTEGPTPGVDRREKWAFVYQVLKAGTKDEVEQYVLPVYGKGLWSTIYGFIALDADGKTIRGITFYDHGETPGLGGEVENPAWQEKWVGKSAYDDDGEVTIRVIKGTLNPGDPTADYTVDGLSGATITTRGVSNFVQYWLGPDAFGPYLQKRTGKRPLATAQSRDRWSRELVTVAGINDSR